MNNISELRNSFIGIKDGFALIKKDSKTIKRRIRLRKGNKTFEFKGNTYFYDNNFLYV